MSEGQAPVGKPGYGAKSFILRVIASTLFGLIIGAVIYATIHFTGISVGSLTITDWLFLGSLWTYGTMLITWFFGKLPLKAVAVVAVLLIVLDIVSAYLFLLKYHVVQAVALLRGLI